MTTTPAPAQFRDWRTSSYSNGGDNCVEIATSSDGQVGVRDTKNRAVAPHVFPRGAWAALLIRARDGGFDLPRGD